MIRFDLELLKIYWFVGIKNNQIVCLGFLGIKKRENVELIDLLGFDLIVRT